MLEELNILNGKMSLSFDPLNSKYTVFLNENEDRLDIEYKLKAGVFIVIDGNYNLKDGSNVIISVSDNKKTENYQLNVYINKSVEVGNISPNSVDLEINDNKVISEYAGPGIASICFILILFLFVILFHKKKIK